LRRQTWVRLISVCIKTFSLQLGDFPWRASPPSPLSISRQKVTAFGGSIWEPCWHRPHHTGDQSKVAIGAVSAMGWECFSKEMGRLCPGQITRVFQQVEEILRHYFTRRPVVTAFSLFPAEAGTPRTKQQRERSGRLADGLRSRLHPGQSLSVAWPLPFQRCPEPLLVSRVQGPAMPTVPGPSGGLPRWPRLLGSRSGRIHNGLPRAATMAGRSYSGPVVAAKHGCLGQRIKKLGAEHEQRRLAQVQPRRITWGSLPANSPARKRANDDGSNSVDKSTRPGPGHASGPIGTGRKIRASGGRKPLTALIETHCRTPRWSQLQLDSGLGLNAT